MIDCLHYTDYTRDAVRLVVEGMETGGEWQDGKKEGQGPHVKMWLRAPFNLKMTLLIIGLQEFCVDRGFASSSTPTQSYYLSISLPLLTLHETSTQKRFLKKPKIHLSPMTALLSGHLVAC